jgi:hypothetical protein
VIELKIVALKLADSSKIPPSRASVRGMESSQTM